MSKKTEIAVINADSAEVAVIPSKEELQIGMRKTLKELENKLTKLGVSATPKQWKTGNYSLFEGAQGAFTPSTLTDIPTLIKILGQVRRAKSEHDELVKEFNLPKTTPCVIWGYSAALWEEDLSHRIKTVSNTEAVKNITAAKTKLEAFLSEDDRLIKTLSEVEKLLK